MFSLPLPDRYAQAHGLRVAEHVRAALKHAGGWFSFTRYMALVLYAPGLGYYAAGATKFGQAGDFTTAPEVSPLFGRTLARQAAQALEGGDVLEAGAGSGKLAADLLLELEKLGALPASYCILELSPDLQARQRSLIAERAPHLLARVRWLDRLPDTFTGVILGNEVLDAMPVHLVERHGTQWRERGVCARDSGFAWETRPIADRALQEAVCELDLPDGCLTEINLAAPAFIASLAAILQRGLMLFIDYGFPRSEYYHPQRTKGTLMCHYRHHAHDDPFLYPGLQDITAHVDFTAIAEAAQAGGLDVLGYTTQANFLLNCGLTDLLRDHSPSDTSLYLPLTNQVQRLTSPAEMGELFKVIALGKRLDTPLLGFTRGDQRHRL